jgi:enoyl-CoA hydratase/carnithine racemase
MVFESPHVRVTAEHGTATLWLGFPGEPANALDLARLRELDAALRAVEATRAIRVLVLRSTNPAGFCAGIHPNALASPTHPTDRAAFAWFGQQVCERLARLDAVTLALIDGPCLGAGLELALACDHRLCVARPTTHLGFPDRLACFGGTARLRHLGGRRAMELLATGETISGREARALGLVDVACCERRGKIELRTLLDRLEARPVKPREPLELSGLAAERRAFAAAQIHPVASAHPVADAPGSPRVNPVPPFPDVVGLLGDDPTAARLLSEVALRGGSAVVCGNREPVFAGIETALARGFVTPLEAEQARLRVRSSDALAGFDRAGLVFVADGHDPFRLAAVVQPRTVVCVVAPDDETAAARPRPDVPFPFPRRVIRIGFCGKGRVALFPGSSTDRDTTATVAAWLKPFGLSGVVFPVAARLLPRAA